MKTGKRLRAKLRGFTLVELMVVIAIIAILMSVAAPQYQVVIRRSKETTLRSNLYELRKAIDMYTLDKQKGLQSLDELVEAGYFRQLPNDPFTGAADWQTEMGDEVLTLDQDQPGITDVHSASPEIGLNGTPYAEW